MPEETHADAVAGQQEAGLAAAEKREREAERASKRKSVPEGAEVAEVTRKGDTAYPYQRHIDDAYDFYGVGSHVVAGALHGIDKEFLTPKEVDGLIDGFLNREVLTADDAS